MNIYILLYLPICSLAEWSLSDREIFQTRHPKGRITWQGDKEREREIEKRALGVCGIRWIVERERDREIESTDRGDQRVVRTNTHIMRITPDHRFSSLCLLLLLCTLCSFISKISGMYPSPSPLPLSLCPLTNFTNKQSNS